MSELGLQMIELEISLEVAVEEKDRTRTKICTREVAGSADMNKEGFT